MIQDEILQRLKDMQDITYRGFQAKLVPTVDKENIIGVRIPDLRKLAKEFSKREDIDDFLTALPHKYYDENQLHALIICLTKDYTKCLEQFKAFLPYIDNWAVCDQSMPKTFKKHRDELLPQIYEWLESKQTYTVRFGIKALMDCFLDDAFDVKYPTRIAQIKTDEYYIHMMVAWYFATALAKQYDAIVPFFETPVLEKQTHNKAIQKARESYRVTPEHKDHLKTLTIR